MKCWIPLLLVLGLGCSGPQARYDWGGYDNHLYTLMKNPGGLEDYGLALKKQMDRHPDDKRMPPGLHAEYGYVLYVTGHKPEAVAHFTREKALWPESALIMDRMIVNCAPKAAEALVATNPVAVPNADPAPGMEAK